MGRGGGARPGAEIQRWAGPADLAGRHGRPQQNPGGTRHVELGPLARPGPRAALSSFLSPVQLARLVGLWHRRARRYGLPQLRRCFLGLATRRALGDRARIVRRQCRNRAEVEHPALPIPGAWRPAAAEIDLIRRRQTPRPRPGPGPWAAWDRSADERRNGVPL